MQRAHGSAEGTRPVIVSGLRGMGKTAFLREIADHARNQDWIVIWTEASKNESLTKKLSRAMYLELRKTKSSAKPLGTVFSHALAVLKSFQLKVDPSGSCTIGVDIEPAKGYADSGDLSLDLGDLLQAIGDAAQEAGTAALVCIDELQEAPENDLAALNVALHAIGQESSPVPVYFAGAGPPTLPAILADATSCAERMYQFHSLDLLTDEAVRDAYVEPTAKSEIHWEEAALSDAIEATHGYPYFIQQCGFCICEQVNPPCTISEQEAHDGIQLAKEELDRGLYKSRWDKATPKGRQMMAAMALDSGPSQLSAVAKRMGKGKASDLSVLRDRLIADELIYAPERIRSVHRPGHGGLHTTSREGVKKPQCRSPPRTPRRARWRPEHPWRHLLSEMPPEAAKYRREHHMAQYKITIRSPFVSLYYVICQNQATIYAPYWPIHRMLGSFESLAQSTAIMRRFPKRPSCSYANANRHTARLNAEALADPARRKPHEAVRLVLLNRPLAPLLGLPRVQLVVGEHSISPYHAHQKRLEFQIALFGASLYPIKKRTAL